MCRRRGYSLLELLLVMAVIVIVGALASPYVFQGMDGQSKVGAAADLIRARWADARAQAIEDCQPYRFAVITNSGRFRIEPYSDNALQNEGIISDDPTTNTATTGFVLEGKLPSPVRFGTLDSPVNVDGEESDSGNWTTVAVFLPTGRAYDDATIVLAGRGASSVTLHLRGLTGAATTIRAQGDNAP